jgi:hypothetical protein
MQKHHEVSEKINTTALKKLVALADGKSIFRDPKLISKIYGLKYYEDEYPPGREKREAFWARVERLKNLEHRHRRRHRGNCWLHRYLEELFRFYTELEGWQRRDLLWFYVPYHAVVQHERHYDAIRVLIDISSASDAKSRSRWAQALRFASRRRDSWEAKQTLPEFFKKNGGVSGCALKMASPRKIKRQQEPRIWA